MHGCDGVWGLEALQKLVVADLTEGSVDFCQLLPLLQIGLDEAAEVLPVIPAQLPGTVNGQA